MGYKVKLQKIERPTNKTFCVTVPVVMVEAMELKNGEEATVKGVKIEAVPAYNTTPDRMEFHPKDRDNGYVLNVDKKRIYISGDTEDIKAIRGLQNIDFAFLCMNLPYPMTVEQAASAVLEMKPKKITPYHYSGKNGISDLNEFKRLVGDDKDIEVLLLDWSRASPQWGRKNGEITAKSHHIGFTFSCQAPFLRVSHRLPQRNSLRPSRLSEKGCFQ